MVHTYREIVSRIQGTLNTLNKDTYIPRRLILSIFKSKAEFLIIQKMNEKQFFGNQNMFQWIECVEMEEVSQNSCGINFKSCDNLMRSKHKLPKILDTNYGFAVLDITNINYSKKYYLKSLSYINNIKNNRFYKTLSPKNVYILDDYLYAPDSTNRVYNLLVFSLDEKLEDYKNGECANYWDMEINIPTKLYEYAYQETLQELTTRIQIPEDENGDMDSNQKTATIQ